MAIPTKDKNILLLPVTDGGVTQTFNMPGFAGYDSSRVKHNGLDLGWTKTQYCNILACQDGTVKQVLVNNSSCGNGIVLQHDYADGTHRWTGYIHLKSAPTLKVGAKVKQGDVIGIRGGSPYVDGKAKYGIHLHLYVTDCNTLTYSWDTMKAHVLNPYPLLYKSKKVTYNVLATGASALMTTLKYIEDVSVNIVSPVTRDETKDQLKESSSNLRVRTSPSLNGSVIGYLTPNVYYDWFETKSVDDYTWYKIATDQWCAKTSTMTIYPAKTELEILKDKVESLTTQVSNLSEENKGLTEQVNTIKKENEDLVSENTQLVEDNSTLTNKNKTLEATNEILQTKITKSVDILTKE